MNNFPIPYRKLKGYKYQTTKDYWVDLPKIFEKFSIFTNFITLQKGRLTIIKGYAWDGPSGPTVDTPSFMRGSLIHDALYQLIREGYLPFEMRIEADKILKSICLEDGMKEWRANYVYFFVRVFGSNSAKK